jgi:hypothetical protein
MEAASEYDSCATDGFATRGNVAVTDLHSKSDLLWVKTPLA